MKSYPSINGPSKGHHDKCYTFLKYDGSNLRFEWSRKRGWYKFGTRNCMFDETSKIFGPAIPLFMEKWADELERVFKSEKTFNGVQSVIVFGEYFGAESFSGMHKPSDNPMSFVPFDINLHKKGFISPKEFLDMFGHLDVAECISHNENFGPALINAVRKETIDLESKYAVKSKIPEGVICKGGSGHKLWMCKIKTERYKEALKVLYEADWEKFWE